MIDAVIVIYVLCVLLIAVGGFISINQFFDKLDNWDIIVDRLYDQSAENKASEKYAANIGIKQSIDIIESYMAEIGIEHGEKRKHHVCSVEPDDISSTEV